MPCRRYHLAQALQIKLRLGKLALPSPRTSGRATYPEEATERTNR